MLVPTKPDDLHAVYTSEPRRQSEHGYGRERPALPTHPLS